MKNKFVSNKYLFNYQYADQNWKEIDKYSDEIGFLGFIYQMSRWYKIDNRTKKYE
ncbi:MAG TPA: hypothetical protein VJZ51_06730 [Bacilli bacterium]|nr:hypothetical protein [Bacilli bacterium]